MGISLPVIGVPDLLDSGAGLDAYLAAQNNLLYYKFDEASGNLIDYGSEDADSVPSSVTQGEPGIAGIGSYLYDGVDDIVTTANAGIPNVVAMTTQRWSVLHQPTSLGENNTAHFISIGDFVAGNHVIRFNTTNRISVFFYNTVPTLFEWTTNTNQVDWINSWAWLFVDFNAATNKARIFKGVSGAVTQLTLDVDSTLTGTVNSPATDLHLGNASTLARTFAGNLAAVETQAALWTTDEMQQRVNLAGV